VRDRVGIAGRVLVARELCLSRVAGLDALNGAKKGLRRAVPRTKESWTSRRGTTCSESECHRSLGEQTSRGRQTRGIAN
jgi:hypothetical protein